MEKLHRLADSHRAMLIAVLTASLLLTAGFPLLAYGSKSDSALQVGDRAPHFSVATNQDTLADYDRDYYGSHHLVLTFSPAAFTPV